MKKKKLKISNIIIPYKNINFFVYTILLLGLISGSIFLLNLKEVDKNTAILQIQNFISNINNNKIDNGQAFKNSIMVNYIFVFLIWGFGLSIIGIIFNIFLTYIKGFIIGFTVGSIILCYKAKGLLLAFTYVFFGQLINVVVICLLTIYSVMFTKNLFGIIFSKTLKKRNYMIKKYLIILIISIVLTFIASLSEIYLFPTVLRVFINIYLKV